MKTCLPLVFATLSLTVSENLRCIFTHEFEDFQMKNSFKALLLVVCLSNSYAYASAPGCENLLAAELT